MANSWLRLWHDLPNDPKWRVIARASSQPLHLVIALYITLLVDASKNMSRGVTQCHDEDLAVTLDCDIEQIAAIKRAMHGRVLDGNRLSGWDTRQPKREDSGDKETGVKSAAERKRAQREREKDGGESNDEAQCHDASRNVTLDKDKDKDIKHIAPAKADVFSFKAELLKLGADPVLVGDWLQVRVTKKARNTKTALDGFIREVKKSGFTYDQALRRCCEKNWSGFDAEWVANIKPPTDTAAIPFDREAFEANKKAALARMREEDAKYTVPPVGLRA